MVQSLGSQERRVLRTGGSDARYLPTGHLTYAIRDLLFAVPFDLERLALTGGPVQVVQGIGRWNIPDRLGGVAHYAVANDGTLV